MKKVGIVFPGQGSQYENMGIELIKSKEKVYSIAEKILSEDVFSVIKKAKLNEISKTRYSQLAIFLNSMSLFNLLDKKNLNIQWMTGLSLGEYTALCASKVIDLESCIKLVDKRSKIMEEGASNKGMMVVVFKSNEKTIRKLINEVKGDDILSISNLNSPQQIVIGGEFSAIKRFKEIAKKMGIKKVVKLNVEGPFHTNILKKSSEIFKHELSKILFKKTSINVYSNVMGNKYNDNIDIVDNLSKQMRTTVNFMKCINNMINDGCNNFIEIGPGRILSGLIKKINKEVNVTSIQTMYDIEKFKI